MKILEKNDRILLRDKIIDELYYNNVIRDLKNTYKMTNQKLFYDYINLHDELKNDYYKYIQQFETEDEALWCILHKDDPDDHRCPGCNNLCPFYNRVHGYRKTCKNSECINKLAHSEVAKQKTIQTNRKNRGTDWPSQCKEVREKVKKTNIEKYGTESPMQNEEIKEKVKKTNVKKYGTEYATQNEEVKEKTKKTNEEKYGCKTPLQSEEIKKKIKRSCINIYGVENPSQNEEVKEKKKKTSLERFGYESFKQAHIKNYEIWINENKFKQFVIDKYNENKTFLTLRDICNFFNVKISTAKKQIEKFNLLNYFYIQKSNLEIEFEKLLINNNIVFDQYNRKILYKEETNAYQEIDFYCKNNKIGFEINDISTHNSLQYNKNTNYYKDALYHQQKSLLSQLYQIRLIHIWEWEMRNKKTWNKLSKWIINELDQNKIKINVDNNYFIKLIDVDQEKEFINLYDLNKYVQSDICMGFFHNNELIQLLSFKRKNNDQYDIISYCTKYGYDTYDVRIFKLIINHFIHHYNPKKIIFYCSIDKLDNTLYKNVGFKLIKITSPQIIWCNKNMNTSDHQKPGYVPIFDCGLEIYEYVI